MSDNLNVYRLRKREAELDRIIGRLPKGHPMRRTMVRMRRQTVELRHWYEQHEDPTKRATQASHPRDPADGRSHSDSDY